jgi:hypothetical protein
VRHMKPSNTVWIAASIALLVLSGCGGDGSSSSTTPPDAPEIDWAPTSIKNFRFTWLDVDGELEYQLLENPDGVSGFTQSGAVYLY